MIGANKLRDGAGSAARTVIIVASCVFVLVPLAFMLGSSLMPAMDIMRMPYRWIPETWKPANYLRALAGNDGSWMYLRNILNSVIVSTTIAASTVLLSSLVGYGLAKFRFKGRDAVFMAIMGTMMIPFETVMIPLYLIVVKAGMQNTYAGLIVPFLMNAFGVFIMRQYLITFPDEMLDAARIDGCSEPRIFWDIVFRNSGPAAATLAVLSFRQQWDNLLWPLLVAQEEKMKTIPAYIVKFTAEKHADEGAMMAVAVIASLPVFIMFFSLSKYFLGGSAVYQAGKE
ncbi:MAG: carbohydrate ABC transporter permease [Spirochaetae bacterium HGW-Spirochaetae-3]|jgi:multiple sugar transport system permease protein|nr:MAG: carbohydrate ABC transporter permease [Spirochaetae bacterium HGW-Spirochaetae-3]